MATISTKTASQAPNSDDETFSSSASASTIRPGVGLTVLDNDAPAPEKLLTSGDMHSALTPDREHRGGKSQKADSLLDATTTRYREKSKSPAACAVRRLRKASGATGGEEPIENFPADWEEERAPQASRLAERELGNREAEVGVESYADVVKQDSSSGKDGKNKSTSYYREESWMCSRIPNELIPHLTANDEKAEKRTGTLNEQLGSVSLSENARRRKQGRHSQLRDTQYAASIAEDSHDQNDVGRLRSCYIKVLRREGTSSRGCLGTRGRQKRTVPITADRPPESEGQRGNREEKEETVESRLQVAVDWRGDQSRSLVQGPYFPPGDRETTSPEKKSETDTRDGACLREPEAGQSPIAVAPPAGSPAAWASAPASVSTQKTGDSASNHKSICPTGANNGGGAPEGAFPTSRTHETTQATGMRWQGSACDLTLDGKTTLPPAVNNRAELCSEGKNAPPGVTHKVERSAENVIKSSACDEESASPTNWSPMARTEKLKIGVIEGYGDLMEIPVIHENRNEGGNLVGAAESLEDKALTGAPPGEPAHSPYVLRTEYRTSTADVSGAAGEDTKQRTMQRSSGTPIKTGGEPEKVESAASAAMAILSVVTNSPLRHCDADHDHVHSKDIKGAPAAKLPRKRHSPPPAATQVPPTPTLSATPFQHKREDAMAHQICLMKNDVTCAAVKERPYSRTCRQRVGTIECSTMKLFQSFEVPASPPYENYLHSISVSPDSRSFACVGPEADALTLGNASPPLPLEPSTSFFSTATAEATTAKGSNHNEYAGFFEPEDCSSSTSPALGAGTAPPQNADEGQLTAASSGKLEPPTSCSATTPSRPASLGVESIALGLTEGALASTQTLAAQEPREGCSSAAQSGQDASTTPWVSINSAERKRNRKRCSWAAGVSAETEALVAAPSSEPGCGSPVNKRHVEQAVVEDPLSTPSGSRERQGRCRQGSRAQRSKPLNNDEAHVDLTLTSLLSECAEQDAGKRPLPPLACSSVGGRPRGRVALNAKSTSSLSSDPPANGQQESRKKQRLLVSRKGKTADVAAYEETPQSPRLHAERGGEAEQGTRGRGDTVGEVRSDTGDRDERATLEEYGQDGHGREEQKPARKRSRAAMSWGSKLRLLER
ncbi:hypothetical protein BESB_048370 [Besnoitia besnoiti]|uniref:Uncharacterized protein n=1 Tax=Besnoitia besnoiti TaxID=94643 RepID=A0A2A9MF94_BESBE|nr:hypothetical protein BESB_048370 [Besnoitia besnoiti]PFH36645.1 hypothetical protein BESB_048370 [Besnoitia besnoiti]